MVKEKKKETEYPEHAMSVAKHGTGAITKKRTLRATGNHESGSADAEPQSLQTSKRHAALRLVQNLRKESCKSYF